MQRIFRILTLLTTALPLCVAAQTLNPADYVYPIKNVQGLYSANFGEMRPNHFHSGVDIKTDGVEGKPVVAVAAGYVSRIAVTPGGYGLALYLTLDNGTTAVYGHLARFSDPIKEYVVAERKRQQKNSLNLWFSADRFRVAQGDVIAFSGNTGGSFGPHLHFEIRETASARTLNIVRQGIIRPKDAIAPYILQIHYIETDTVRGVPIHRAPRTYEAVKVDPHTYRLARQAPIPAGDNGYFVVEATDRRDGVSNRFGIYRTTLCVDDEPRIEYRMDGFTFDQSRDCNAAACYPLQLRTRNEAIRLVQMEGAPGEFYPVNINRGIVSLAEGELRAVCIEVEDDCGNTSRIRFDVEGRAPWRAEVDTLSQIADHRRRTTLSGDGATLSIPIGALYESLFVRVGRSDTTPRIDTSTMVLSPVYRLLDRTTPLRKAVDVHITAFVPEALRPHAALAVINDKGRAAYAGGSWKQDGVRAHTTVTGEMLVVADTVPPTIKPLFTPGGNLSQSSRLTFRIGDNFSGIASCEMQIDGEWVVCDRLPMKGTAFHTFTDPRDGKDHTVSLIVRDNCGNETVWEGSFVR